MIVRVPHYPFLFPSEFKLFLLNDEDEDGDGGVHKLP